MRRSNHTIVLILATIVALIIVLTASSSIVPSQADGQWYAQLRENERAYYLIGYLTANTVWANGIYEANEMEPLSDPVKHIYRLLSPASSYTWHEIDNAIMSQYNNGVGLDTPTWHLIHTYADTTKEQGGSM